MKKFIFLFVIVILPLGLLMGQDKTLGFVIGSNCKSSQTAEPYYALFIVSEDGKVLEYVEDNTKQSESFLKVLNPDWIESLSVTKGEEAVSKYGEQGKYGVVSISLQKGSMTKMPEVWQKRFIEKEL